MNYFSHFVVDHIKDKHEYNTGLLLPDITKRWIKKFRYPEPDVRFTVAKNDLLNGCLKHYESDKKFHSSSFFSRNFETLNNLVKKVNFTPELQRRWFLSHIMFELLLDRVIVRDHELLLDSFYESLNKSDDAILDQFLRVYGMTNTEDFFNFFNHFRSVKYIYFYTDNKKFLYSLNRIMMRAGLKEMNDTDLELLEEVLITYEGDYFSDSAKVMTELKQVFK